jgi:hypothetical protein
MPNEPDALVEALARTEDAFSGQLGRPEYEAGLDPSDNDADVIQLRKACRLLDACRLLRDHDGYHRVRGGGPTLKERRASVLNGSTSE